MKAERKKQINDAVSIVQRVAAKREQGGQFTAEDDQGFADLGCQCSLCKRIRAEQSQSGSTGYE